MREYVEISGIPPSFKDNELETKVLAFLKKLMPLQTWISSDLSPLTIQRKLREGDFDIEPLQIRKEGSIEQKKLNLDPETVNLPSGSKFYINESLCRYYRKLWPKCRKLWDPKYFFFICIDKAIDIYSNYDNVLLAGDFNTEEDEPCLSNFLYQHDLYNLVKEGTCFKIPLNPHSLISF